MSRILIEIKKKFFNLFFFHKADFNLFTFKGRNQTDVGCLLLKRKTKNLKQNDN